MTAYYNEHDPKAAAWLRELIKQGHIAPGIVDERSIEDITPADLKGYTQCHFFAGIGVWSYALRRAGWPDDKPVWTGSCPCQPFSAAGKGAGFIDERHLWPAWYHLITQCEPDRIFGEQVASKDGLGWLDLVQTDLEAAGYANGAVDLCAAGVGAPHIRQRLWFVAEGLADTNDAGPQGFGRSGEKPDQKMREGTERHDGPTGNFGGLAHPLGDGFGEGQTGQVETRPATRRDVEGPGPDQSRELSAGLERPNAEHASGMANTELQQRPEAPASGDETRGRNETPAADPGLRSDSRLADSEGGGQSGRDRTAGQNGQETVHYSQPSRLADADRDGCSSRSEASEASGHGDTAGAKSGDDRHGSAGPTNGLWRDADWLFCRDGKWRAVEPGTFPLAHGAAERVGRLRGYGNAINAEAATAFIESYLEC